MGFGSKPQPQVLLGLCLVVVEFNTLTKVTDPKGCRNSET